MTKLSAKIKDDWGSLKRFCAKNNINYNTYQVVVSGHATSKRIIDILVSHKYIKHTHDLTSEDCRVAKKIEHTAKNEKQKIEKKISKYKILIANEEKKLISINKVEL